MHKLLLGMIIVGTLSGCATQSALEQPKAAVSEKSTRAQITGNTSPATQIAVTANPLKDPDNILSRRSIYYDYDSSAIKNEDKPLIEAHAKYLSAHKEAKVTIQGNTDERGSREYNISLGNQRAANVAKMMNALGVPSTQVEAVSLGQEKPRASCHDESCWKENRRSDLVYQGE